MQGSYRYHHTTNTRCYIYYLEKGTSGIARTFQRSVEEVVEVSMEEREVESKDGRLGARQLLTLGHSLSNLGGGGECQGVSGSFR